MTQEQFLRDVFLSAGFLHGAIIAFVFVCLAFGYMWWRDRDL